MKSKRIIGIVLIAAILGSGCNVKDTVSDTDVSESLEIVDITTVSETESELPETEALVPFEFNAHVYSAKLSERIPQDYWDSFYNLCDALRAGENTFECSSQDAYDWCTDVTVLCNLFPAAGLQVEGKSDDGSPAFENGIGKIHYNMPVEDYLKRQADFEDLIVDIINEACESDDTDYEKALKLYLYVADNFDYEYEVIEEDNYVYKTFTKKVGQCINFGAVYAYLLLQVGVDALGVGTYDGLCHAWTYVVINGEGYHIDTTWALRSCYTDLEYIYLDYFMMSDVQRNEDNCLVEDLTVNLLPEYWVSKTDLSYAATDEHYNIRYYCGFVSLDEENKIVNYVDMYDEMHSFYYGD